MEISIEYNKKGEIVPNKQGGEYMKCAMKLQIDLGEYLCRINPKQTMGGLNQDAAYSAASPCQMNKV